MQLLERIAGSNVLVKSIITIGTLFAHGENGRVYGHLVNSASVQVQQHYK